MAAYDDSSQRVPPPFQKKDGHVRIDFLSGDEDKDWKQEAMERLPATLERLQDNGYALKRYRHTRAYQSRRRFSG